MNIKPGKSVAKIQKALFKVCHEIVKTRYTQTDPDNRNFSPIFMTI